MSSEVAESYRAPLEDLKMNSKPQISMLTMLAEDHEPNATEIVSVIQEQIHKVPAARKLPIMYLVDSIIKNLPKTSYPNIFGNSIVDIFCGVFEEVDEVTRSQLYKLRQTWVDILPNKRLYALDVQVKTIDANWPVTAKPPNQGVIHVNPKFLKPSKEKSPQFSPNHSERSSPKSSPKDDDLIEKQKEIQRLKLELEMATIKNKLEQEKKRLEGLHVGRRFTPREPPPSIQLPPAGLPQAAPTSVLKPTTRDPRLNRDPRINRDPRLKKQVGFQEPPAKEEEDVKVADTSRPEVNSQDVVVSKAPNASLSGSSITSKVDYASLLQELSNAANKVAKEKKSPPKPALAPHSLKPAKTVPPTKPEQTSGVASVSNKESQKAKNSKDIKSKEKDGKKEEKSNNSTKSTSKINKTSGSSKDKPSSNKDVKSNDSGSRKDRDKGERKDSDRHRGPEKQEARVDKRSGSEGGRRSPRRGLRKSSPDYRRENFNHRDSRQSAPRVRDRPRDESVINKSADGKTDQFGRMLREDEKRALISKSRDRSPIDRVRSTRDESAVTKSGDKTDIKVKKESTKKDKVKKVNSSEEIKTEKDSEAKRPNESVFSEIQDVDMRNKEVIKEECTTPSDDSKEHPLTEIEKIDESKENQLKRKSPKTNDEELENEPSIPPYKIPKLSERKTEDSNTDLERNEKVEKENESIKEDEISPKKEEDISQLFGGEDVDYRKIPGAPTPLMIPPPMPSMSLLSPVSSAALKSPAQQRWNQFKESHPTDFVHDMERKRLRDVQMQSMEPVEDVDMRPLVRHPLAPSKMPIPKDLSIENQEQILRTAEKKLKDGQISHTEHQEIIKQLEQVYDMKRKGHSKEDTPSKPHGLKEDPRVRGMFARDAEKRGPNSDFVSQRRLYGLESQQKPIQESFSRPKETMHTSPRYGERAEDLGTSQISPKEDFITRPIRGEPQQVDPRDFDERRGLTQKYDERSSRDFDERVQGQYRDYNSRNRGDYESISLQRREDYDRLRREKVGRPIRRDDRDNHSPNEFPSRDDFDRRRPNPEEMRNDRIRDRDDHREFYDDPDYRNRVRRGEDRNFRGSPPVRDQGELQPPQHMTRQRPQDGFPMVPPRMTCPVLPEISPLGPRGPLPASRGPLPASRGPLPVPRRPGPMQGAMPGSVRPENVPPLDNPANKGSNGPMPVSGMQTDQEIVRPLPTPVIKKISDPLDDPRWAVMRGMLENEGTEELVIDGKPFELRMGTSRKLRIDGSMMDVAVDLKERGIRIDGQLVYKLGEPIKEVPAIGKLVKLYYHGMPKPIWLDGQQHEMRLDAPPRNVMVDGEKRGFQIDGRDEMILVDRLEKGAYGGPPRRIRINGIEHEISFQPPPRQITIDGKACKLKLESKIPCVIIDGKPHGIRFDGEPRPVVINDQTFTIPVDRAEKIRLGARPMYVAFGGPAHELIIDGKWFEVKFDNLPKDIHLGNRHFVIRLPGPLPKVKILDELPQDIDESRLFSSNKTIPEKLPMQGPLVTPVTGPIPGNPNLITGGNQGSGMPVPQGAVMQPMLSSGNLPMMPLSGMPGLNMVNQPINTQGNPLMMPPGNQPGQQMQLDQLGPMNMARNMMNSQQNPALLKMGAAAGIFAGLSAGMRHTNLSQPPPNLLPPPQSVHSVAMATGLQGGAFNSQIKPNPQDDTIPVPAAPSVQPISVPNLPGLLALKNLFPPSTTSSTTAAPSTASTTASEAGSKGPIDINSLLNNLLKVGLIKDGNKAEKSSSPGEAVKTEAPQTAEEKPTLVSVGETTPQKKSSISDLTNFSPHDLKIKRIPVIDALHEGIQCHTCSTRFTMSDHAKYREHLDWHFRQNKMEQEMMKVAKNRKWFYSVMDWIQYEELEETEDKNRSEIFEQMRFNDGDAPAPAPTIYKALEGKHVIKNPVATGAEGEDVCATCGDPFDQSWNEETEEWILKNTIKVDGKTYHPVCYEDVSETPTPAVAPQKNPLDDQLSQLATIKSEVKEEPSPATSAPATMDVIPGSKDVTPDMVSVKMEPNSAIQELSAEGRLSELSALAPKLLSTIASQVQREVIPVSHEDDSCVWDMDSNPTPELSRTPTPEPIVSFTPVASLSAESVTSGPAAPVLSQEEEPIPIKVEPATPMQKASEEDSTSQNHLTPKQEPSSPDLSPPRLEPMVPGLERYPTFKL